MIAQKVLKSSIYKIQGIGKLQNNESESYYVAAKWTEADELRSRFIKEKQWFYINLGFGLKDIDGKKLVNLKY